MMDPGRRQELAEAVTALHYERRPELAQRYGPAGRARCLQDAGYHLAYLFEAVASSSPDLFADYVAWARIMLEGRGIPCEDLAGNLEVLREVLRRDLPEELARLASGYVDAGLERLPQLPARLPPGLTGDGLLDQLARDYLQALMQGERHVASRMILDAVAGGVSVKEIYLRVFQPCQHEIGRLWQMNRLSVAEEHYCTAATQLVMSQLYPFLFGHSKSGRTLVAACVSGDLHEIGVRMIADFFEIEGWSTFYLGANVPAAGVIRTLRDRGADVLAVSATMPFHVRAVAELIAAVRASEAGDRVKILVGGYPFLVDPELWRSVGADATARDAEESVAVANRLLEARV
jgi:MerR family transcriptional regulator, light-induced transcriptional regulator